MSQSGVGGCEQRERADAVLDSCTRAAFSPAALQCTRPGAACFLEVSKATRLASSLSQCCSPVPRRAEEGLGTHAAAVQCPARCWLAQCGGGGTS